MIVAAAVIAVALVAVVLVLRARTHRAATRVSNDTSDASWTDAVGAELRGLPESERCDLIFAVAALDDDRSRGMLERALNDPSEPVALAAARALARRGCSDVVERHLASCPSARTSRIAAALALLTFDS